MANSHVKVAISEMWASPSLTETTGTSTNWNFACKVTMPAPSAAWIKDWIETDSLWKPTVAVGVHGRSLHLLIGQTEKILDCIQPLVLPLSNPISQPPYFCLFLRFHTTKCFPCYAPYRTILVKTSPQFASLTKPGGIFHQAVMRDARNHEWKVVWHADMSNFLNEVKGK